MLVLWVSRTFYLTIATAEVSVVTMWRENFTLKMAPPFLTAYLLSAS